MPRPALSAADLALLDPDGSFRGRLAEDRARIAALVRPSPAKAQLAELQRVVHQLAGAAGTFGFAEIGDLAVALDDALLAGVDSTATAPLFHDLLAALARA